MKGFIYVISNPSLPGLVKIGYSMKDPHLRAKNDFDPAGLPDDYTVAYLALVDNPREVEQQTHARLRGHHHKKEWFRVEIKAAIDAIHALSGRIYYEEKAGMSSLVAKSAECQRSYTLPAAYLDSPIAESLTQVPAHYLMKHGVRSPRDLQMIDNSADLNKLFPEIPAYYHDQILSLAGKVKRTLGTC